MASISDEEKQIVSTEPCFHSSIPTQPTKRQKISEWKFIFTKHKTNHNSNRSTHNEKKAKKSSKKKSNLPKIIKDKSYKKIESKFMNLIIKQKQILMNHSIRNDDEQFSTIAEMAGFDDSEIKQLFVLLSTHFDSIRTQSKQVQTMMFEDTAPVHFVRCLKQQWNKKSRTILTAQKRDCLIALQESGLFNNKSTFIKRFMDSNTITSITNCQIDAMRTMARIKGIFRLPSIKQKNNKIVSINDTLTEIKNKNKNNNQNRATNMLCDQIIQMKHILGICRKELKERETEIDLLLISLRIIKYNGDERIHLSDQKIRGKIPRAPELLAVFDEVLKKINEMKEDINGKLDNVKNIFTKKTVKNIQTNSAKMKKAKAIDSKRKAKRKRAKELESNGNTADLNLVESDDNDNE